MSQRNALIDMHRYTMKHMGTNIYHKYNLNVRPKNKASLNNFFNFSLQIFA